MCPPWSHILKNKLIKLLITFGEHGSFCACRYSGAAVVLSLLRLLLLLSEAPAGSHLEIHFCIADSLATFLFTRLYVGVKKE